MVDHLTRRRFLRAAALLSVTGGVSACNASPPATASTGARGTGSIAAATTSSSTTRATAVAATAPTASASSTASVSVAAGDVEISIWGEKAVQYKPVAAQFAKLHPEIHAVVTSAPSAQYHDQLLARMAANDYPDMAMIVDTEFMRFVTSAFLSDLSAHIKSEPGWDAGAAGYNWFYPAITQFFTPNGKPYAVPISVNPIGIGFNIDLFKKAGVPTPYDQWKQGTWTWQAFLDTAHKMTSVQGGVRTWGYTGQENIWNVATRIWQNGGDIFNADKTQVIVDQPAAYEAIQWLFDLGLKQDVAPPNLRSADAAPLKLFPSGGAAMIEADTNTRFTLKGTQINWGVAPQPKQVQYASWTGGSGYTIPIHAKHPDGAWAFISYASSVAGASVLMQQGAAASAVIKVMESPAFLTTPPQYVETFLDMLKTAHPEPFITQNDKFLAYWNAQMDLVATGKSAARDADAEIKRLVEPLLTPTG